mgnify:CR=1|jgi:hypothetical protein
MKIILTESQLKNITKSVLKGGKVVIDKKQKEKK